MDQHAIDQAAAILVAARHSGERVDRLPESCRPGTPADALAIQDRILALLAEPVAGWKVSPPIDNVLMRGAILASRLFDSPASVPARLVPLLGVEVEIAFRLDRALPPREAPYAYEEVAAAVTAFPAIEIVDSRFRAYKDTPLLDRSADFVSNGGLVRGAPRDDWRRFDLAGIEAQLIVDGTVEVAQVGGHVAGDPLLPAVALANDRRGGEGLARGTLVTTGTYTGLRFVRPGQRVVGRFAGFGDVELHLTA